MSNELTVECLRCGELRAARRSLHRLEAGECARCGYLGWAGSADLSERTRGALRQRPVELRRLHAVP